MPDSEEEEEVGLPKPTTCDGGGKAKKFPLKQKERFARFGRGKRNKKKKEEKKEKETPREKRKRNKQVRSAVVEVALSRRQGRKP